MSALTAIENQCNLLAVLFFNNMSKYILRKVRFLHTLNFLVIESPKKLYYSAQILCTFSIKNYQNILQKISILQVKFTTIYSFITAFFISPTILKYLE